MSDSRNQRIVETDPAVKAALTLADIDAIIAQSNALLATKKLIDNVAKIKQTKARLVHHFNTASNHCQLLLNKNKQQIIELKNDNEAMLAALNNAQPTPLISTDSLLKKRKIGENLEVSAFSAYKKPNQSTVEISFSQTALTDEATDTAEQREAYAASCKTLALKIFYLLNDPYLLKNETRVHPQAKKECDALINALTTEQERNEFLENHQMRELHDLMVRTQEELTTETALRNKLIEKLQQRIHVNREIVANQDNILAEYNAIPKLTLGLTAHDHDKIAAIPVSASTVANFSLTAFKDKATACADLTAENTALQQTVNDLEAEYQLALRELDEIKTFLDQELKDSDFYNNKIDDLIAEVDALHYSGAMTNGK